MLKVDHLSFAYGDSDNFILQDLTFEVSSGEFVLICGESGSGKSTLLKNIVPALAPYGKRLGSIWVANKDLSEYTPLMAASQIGFVGQSPDDQIVTDTVMRELAFGLENLGLSRDVMFRRIAEVAEFFGISGWVERETKDLSGGEKQLLNLAAVMAMEPKLLLLDEPTSQLDPISATNFLHMIARIHTELGTTIVMVEHHLEEVYAMADRVMVLENGKSRYFDTPENVARDLQRDAVSIYRGMPAAYRIAGELGAEMEHPPLCVVDGQRWIEDYAKSHPQLKPEIKRRVVSDANVVISVKNLDFRYSESERAILHNCSFSVKKQEFFCILGGNGAGKSTLLRVLCGGLEPENGKVEILGKRLGRKNETPLGFGQMVYLPQDPKALFTEISVEDELLEALDGVEQSDEEKERAVQKMIARLGIDGLERMHPYDLSGGQTGLLALGKLLLLKPKILLLDEPTKGLDPERKQELGQFLEQLRIEGLTILMVSHDVEFVAEFGTRCGMLFAGELVVTDEIHSFFAENRFFTSAAHRVARRVVPEAITVSEVVSAWAN